MTEPATMIRRALPGKDPYSATARDAALRLLFAAEAAEREIAVVGTCLAYFLEDPPASLSYGAPARQATTAAERLRNLADQLDRAVTKFLLLEEYGNQFDTVDAGSASA